jgi:hypothetical protein
MKMNVKNAAAVAAGLLLLSSTVVMAQQPSGSGTAERVGATSQEVPPGSENSNDSAAHSVLRLSSVEIIRSSHTPYLDIIRVRGLASTKGWEEVELVPLTRGIPADGVLQLILVARPPEAAADATGYEPVEAILPLETDHPFKGVNVHAATNAISVTTLPGYAEAKSMPDDCGSCVGKIFLPKGTAGSSGRGDAVREDQLPPDTRVVRPADGMKESDSNPNRLTLILDKDNRIVTAAWE